MVTHRGLSELPALLKWILVLQPGVSDLILSISNMSSKEFKSFSHCVYGIWLLSDDINK